LLGERFPAIPISEGVQGIGEPPPPHPPIKNINPNMTNAKYNRLIGTSFQISEP
jgi:hypothetical protein